MPENFNYKYDAILALSYLHWLKIQWRFVSVFITKLGDTLKIAKDAIDAISKACKPLIIHL